MMDSVSVIDEFFVGRVLRIPVYQRNYEWKTENCKRLFDDILELSECDNRKHFFGTVIYQIDTRTDEKIIIDGQQRLITVAILLNAIKDMIREGAIPAKEGFIKDEIGNKLVHQYKGTVFIRPVKKDADIYTALIRNSAVVEESNLCANYLYFCQRIREISASIDADSLYRAINNLHVIIVRLSTEDGDDPQAVFESINSTGLSLTDGDRIRNYILMNAAPKEQVRIHDIYWSPIEHNLDGNLNQYFRDYITATTSYVPNRDAVYAEFRKYAVRMMSEGRFEEVLIDMLRLSGIYSKMLRGDFIDSGLKEASRIMRHINHLDAKVTYPFILSVMDLHISGSDLMPTDEVVKVLGVVENMLVRRSLCNVPSNSMNKIFPSLFKTIMSMGGCKTLSERLKHVILGKDGSSRYPLDKEVLDNIRVINLYSHHRTCSLILSLLENSNRDTIDTLDRIESGELSIEHVLPQKPSDGWRKAIGPDYEAVSEEWTNRLGNLTLTAYNSEYSNRTYSEKRSMKGGFLESGLKLNQYMKEHENWTAAEMSERNELLAKRFLTVLPELTTSYVPDAKVSGSEHMPTEDGVFTGNLICGYVLDGIRTPCKNAKETYVSLMSDLCERDPDGMRAVSLTDCCRLYIRSIGGDNWAYIGQDMYLFTNVANHQKMRIIRQVMESMDMDAGDVKIVVKTEGGKKDDPDG